MRFRIPYFQDNIRIVVLSSGLAWLFTYEAISPRGWMTANKVLKLFHKARGVWGGFLIVFAPIRGLRPASCQVFSKLCSVLKNNLPPVGKIPLVYPGRLLALAYIGQLTLTTSALYVSSRKRPPFCRFLGNNFEGKSYRRKCDFGGTYLRQLTYQTYLKPYPSQGLISVSLHMRALFSLDTKCRALPMVR